MHTSSVQKDEQKTYQHLIVLIHWTKSELPEVAKALNFEKIISTIRRTDKEHHIEMIIYRGELQKEVSSIEKRILSSLPSKERDASHKYNPFRVVTVLENIFDDTATKAEIEYLKSRFMGYTPDVLPSR